MYMLDDGPILIRGGEWSRLRVNGGKLYFVSGDYDKAKGNIVGGTYTDSRKRCY